MLPALSPAANAALFVAAALAVGWAGARLTRSADQLAERTGLGREWLGLLLLGGVTSLPELAVGVSATLAGTPQLSVNDVLGSASINLVILAVADAVYGRAPLTSTPATPQIMLQGVLGIVLLAVVVGATVTSDVTVAGLGAWSWLLIGAYLVALRIVSKSQGLRSWLPTQGSGTGAASPEKAPQQLPALRRLLLRIGAFAAVILVAGVLLSHTGEALARQTGLGVSFFGAVLLAASTSLPEAVTVLAALRLKRYEMAMADVLGTNLFNVTILAVVDALHPGAPVLQEAGAFAAFGALLALVLTALFLVGMLERRDRTVWRMGVDSLAVLAVYAAGVVLLYRLR